MSSRPGTNFRTGIISLSLLALLLTVGLGVLLWQAVQLSSVATVADKIDTIRPWATGMRLALIGLVAMAWPKVVKLAQKAGHLRASHGQYLLAQRWRLAGWLLVIELVLGQGLLTRLFTYVRAPIA
ncbi:MAG: hypothetical protein KDI88_16945 [Gammaproteobacteria bacterium]|nr:hypothetical protein [Gammaproteobacteria bacterium]